MQMSLQLMPTEGQQDLAWLARTTGDLTEIYNFLLRAQIEADIDDEVSRPLTGSNRKAAVEGRALQEGTPLVEVSQGSIILQLSQFLEATTGVQVLAAFGLLLKKGPEIAAFPNKLRKAWYSSAEEALRARNVYEQLKNESVVNVLEQSRGQSATTGEPVLGQLHSPPVSAPRVGEPTRERPTIP